MKSSLKHHLSRFKGQILDKPNFYEHLREHTRKTPETPLLNLFVTYVHYKHGMT